MSVGKYFFLKSHFFCTVGRSNLQTIKSGAHIIYWNIWPIMAYWAIDYTSFDGIFIFVLCGRFWQGVSCCLLTLKKCTMAVVSDTTYTRLSPINVRSGDITNSLWSLAQCMLDRRQASARSLARLDWKLLRNITQHLIDRSIKKIQ